MTKGVARQQLGGRGSGLTPRVRRAVEFYVHGLPDRPTETASFDDLAEAVNLTARALCAAWKRPSVQATIAEETRLMRLGERPASVRTMAEIRDSPDLRKTAAGQRVRLQAAQALETDPTEKGGTTVNVGVGVNVSTPGYVIDLSGPDRDRQSQKLTEDMVNPLITPDDL